MTPYRDGFAAGHQRYHRRRREIERKAAQLGTLRRLPASSRQRLQQLAAALDGEPADLQELTRLEALVDQYERALTDTDNLLRQIEAERERRLPRRRRRLAALVGASACFFGTSAVAWSSGQNDPSAPARSGRHDSDAMVADLRDAPATVQPAVTVQDMRCSKRSACLFNGRCSAGEQGDCVVASDRQCTASVHCDRLGRCSRDGARCVAKSDADCQRALICSQGGACTASEGACIR